VRVRASGEGVQGNEGKRLRSTLREYSILMRERTVEGEKVEKSN